MEKKKTSTAMDNGLYITCWCIIGTLLLLVLFIKATNIQLSKYLFPCVLHSLTGLYCPGCGGTRAVYWLLKGNVAYSLHYHSIVLYGAVLYVWYMLSNTVQYVSRGRITIGMKYRPVYGKIAVVLLVVNTIWKNGNLLLFHKGL